MFYLKIEMAAKIHIFTNNFQKNKIYFCVSFCGENGTLWIFKGPWYTFLTDEHMDQFVLGKKERKQYGCQVPTFECLQTDKLTTIQDIFEMQNIQVLELQILAIVSMKSKMVTILPITDMLKWDAIWG